MSQELIYTSAPRGLKPGSRGFCTVLSTQGMPAPLATTLEGLSAYRPLFPPADSRAGTNPVVWSHLKVSAIGRTLHVLSRIADSGLDYSNRANKLAHHLIVDPSELLPAGPASLLMTSGVMRTSWNDEPRVVPARPVRQSNQASSGICTAWQTVTGDAGWAGVLAEAFLADPERLAIILFQPGQNILPLFEESISLLPAEQRWNVTFSTYFTSLAPGVKCGWRAMIHDSKEAHESLRQVNALRIDLTRGRLGPAAGGKLVDAARTGVRADQPTRRVPVTTTGATREEIEFAEAEEHHEEFAPAPMHSVPDLPIRLETHDTQRTRSSTMPRRTQRSTDFNATPFGLRPQHFWIAGFLLIIAIAVGAAWCLGAFAPEREILQVALADPNPPDQAPVPAPSTEESKRKAEECPKSSQHNKGDNKANLASTDTANIPTKKTDDSQDDSGSKATDEPKTPAEPKPDIPKVPKVFTSSDFGFVVAEYSFADGSEITPEELHKLAVKKSFRPFEVLAPRWLNWSLAKKLKSNEILSLQAEGSHDQSFAALEVISRSMGVEYRLKTRPALLERSKELAWCGLEISASEATNSLPERGRFSGPISIPKEGRGFKDDLLDWQTGLPLSNSQNLELHIERLILADEKTRYQIDAESLSIGTPFCHEIRAIVDRVKKLADIKHSKAELEVKVLSTKGEAEIVIEIRGISGKNGLIAIAEEHLKHEKETIKNVDRPQLGLKDKVYINKLFTEEDVISRIESLVNALDMSGLRASINQQFQSPAREMQLKLLDEIESLPKKCDELRARHDQLKALEHELRTVRVVSAKITYDVFRVSDVKKEAPIKFDLIDFDETTESKP